MKDFPDELKVYIFSLLRDLKSLNNASQVSKDWNRIGNDDRVWSSFFKSDTVIKDTKAKLKYSLTKILYYQCTSSRMWASHIYGPKTDLKFLEDGSRKIEFYTPRAIGMGTIIGCHADILTMLKTVQCIVVHVVEDGLENFATHLNTLFNIVKIKIENIPHVKSPEVIKSFPKVPIIIIAESSFVPVIEEKARLKKIPISAIIPGKLFPSKWQGRGYAHNIENKKVFEKLEEVIMQLKLEKEPEVEDNYKGCCLLQ